MGENLIIRRKLIVLNKENVQAYGGSSWLLTNIFHTRYTSGGNVCNVIIDGGSCKNMISIVIVEKSNLKYEKYPCPYHVSWIKKGSEVTIDKRYLVKISIGDIYKDEVWCGVILMDACYILLGRPW